MYDAKSCAGSRDIHCSVAMQVASPMRADDGEMLVST
jgi:hypothetical protein